MNFDHLTRLADKLAGVIVSVKKLPNGFSFIIKPDDAQFTDRRFVAHSSEVQPPGAEIKPGVRVQFLPGTPRGGHKMPRAYSIEVAGTDVR